jgi:UPF0755 protein
VKLSEIRTRNHIALWTGVALLALLLVCGGAWVAWASLPPPGTGTVRLVIPYGASSSEIARACREAGLVRSASWFALLIHWSGADGRLQPGEYEIARGTSLPQLISVLEEGRSRTVRVTIPEGFTVVQIADRLAAAGVCNRDAFLAEVQHGSFQEPFLRTLPADPRIKYRLEGYLFPDTYEFVPNESAHEAVDEFLQNFQRHVDPIMPELKKRGLTLPQLITEASLIEREAKVDKERPIIASVIENRLHHRPPMKLQIDATLEYILGHRDVVTIADTKVNDPYNTYLYEGLPPGPIANPGMASIEAALHPARTPYLYYVVRNDGSGEHYFAVTAQQQLQNEQRSEQNLKRLEGRS